MAQIVLVALVVSTVTAVVLSTSAHADQLRVSPTTPALGAQTIQSANATTHGTAVLTVGGSTHAYFVAQPGQGTSGAQNSKLVDVTPPGTTSTLGTSSTDVAEGFDVAADGSTTTPHLFVTSGPSTAQAYPTIAVFNVGTSGVPTLSTSSALRFDPTSAGHDLSGYVATYLVVDPNSHRGYVSLSRSGSESYVGEFATGGSAPIGVLGVVDAKTTTRVRLAVDRSTGSLYYAELGGTAVRRIRLDGSLLGTVEAMSCLQFGAGQLGGLAVAGGSIYVADLAYAQLWRISDIASATGCTATAIDVSGQLSGVDDVAVTTVVNGGATTYRVFAASVLPCVTAPSSGEGCVATVDSVTQAISAPAPTTFGVQALLPVTTPGAQVGTVLAVGQSSAKDIDVATLSTGGSGGTATLTPSVLPTGTVGSPYSAVVTTIGGTGTAKLTAAWAGASPGGLNLSTVFDGVQISGVPTALGTFSLSVTWSGGTKALTLYVTAAACSSSNVSATRPSTAYPKYTATTSDECAPWGLAALAGGSPVSLTGYRSAQQSALVPQQLSVDLGTITTITSIALTPASGQSNAFPAGAKVVASNTAGCASGTTTVTANLQQGVPLTPPVDGYRYVCVLVSTLPAGSPITNDPSSGYYFALGSFAVTTCQCATFSPSALPRGRVGNYYAQTVTFSSGSLNTPPTRTTVVAPVQPSGLPTGFVASTGVTSATLNGTPLAAGNYSVAAAAVAGGQTFHASYSLVVDPAVAFLDAASGKLTLPGTPVCQQTLGCPYDAALRVSGASGLTVAVAAGSTLPAGLQLGKASDGTWHLSGRLSPQLAAGPKTFSLRATDDDTSALPIAGSQTVTATLNVTAPAVTFTPATLPVGVVGQPYQATISPSPGGALYLNHNPAISEIVQFGLTIAITQLPGTQVVNVTGTPTADVVTAGGISFAVCAAGQPEICRDYVVTATGSTSTRGTVDQSCDKVNAVTASTDGSATFTASTSHDCDGFSETALLFADDDPVPGDGAWGKLVRPAQLRGYLTTPSTSSSSQTVTLDLGSAKTVRTVHLTPVLGALPVAPSVKVSATSATCADGAMWQSSTGYLPPPAGNDAIFGWDFVAPAAQAIRYVCVSGTTAMLGSAFGALQGEYAFGLQFVRTQSTWAAMTRVSNDAVPHATATLQITGSHDNVVQFAGSGWAGLTPQVSLTCRATLDCSTALPNGTQVSVTATVDSSGVLSGTIMLPAGRFWTLDDPWVTLAVVGTQATGATTTRAAVASAAINDGLPSYYQPPTPNDPTAVAALDVCGVASTTAVAWTAYDATGAKLGQPQTVGWKYLPGAGGPLNSKRCYTAEVTWPPSAAYVRITETTTGKPTFSLWWRGPDYLTSLTSPFVTAS